MDATTLIADLLKNLKAQGCQITLAISIGNTSDPPKQLHGDNAGDAGDEAQDPRRPAALDRLQRTEAYELLRKTGIKDHVAADLSSKFTLERIRTVINHIGSEPHLTNRPGMIVSALANNWYRNGRRSRKDKNHEKQNPT